MTLKKRELQVSLAGIEFENRDALIENRDALIKNRDVVIENRVSILDSCRDRESSVNLLLNGTVYYVYNNGNLHQPLLEMSGW